MYAAPTTLDYATPVEYSAVLSRVNPVAGFSPAWPVSVSPAEPATQVSNKYISIGWGLDYAQHLSKLDALTNDLTLLPEGAVPPSRTAIAVARKILDRCLVHFNSNPDKVVATVDGGIAICFINGNKYSDIECRNDGGMLGVTTNRRDRPIVWEIQPSLSSVDSACAKIKKFIGKNTR